MHRRYYRLYKKHLNLYRLHKQLTKLKKKKPWIKELGSQAIQEVAERIDKSYKLFFLNIKQGVKASPPGFKGKHKYRSFTLKQAGWSIEANKLRIGDYSFKFSKSREVEGVIKTVTIKRDSLGAFYVVLSCECEVQPNKVTSGKSVGFDFGLNNFLTAQNGSTIQAPLFFKDSLVALKKASKALSKKQKGSNNRKKAKLKLARLHQTIANKRTDFQHKLAKTLAKEYEAIFIEDLNLKRMQQQWGRKASDLGFGSFVQILEYNCTLTGSTLVKVPRYFPSSKTCSECCSVNSKLRISEKTWTCSECGSQHQRDVNAAKNIFRVGASTLSLEKKTAISIAISSSFEARILGPLVVGVCQ